MGVAFDICLSLQPDCLDAFPALKEFAAACTALPCFGEYKAHEMYFLRK